MSIDDELFVSKLNGQEISVFRSHIEECIKAQPMHPKHAERLLRFLSIAAELVREKMER